MDVELFALFMRSTMAPPRDLARAATPNAQAGSTLFNSIGCATCHTREIVTAPPGTLINGGALKVANALGNKRIRPFGDFLLHDIGTGDGIVQNGGQSTRNKIRTAPLWGLRARGRFMHDSLSFSLTTRFSATATRRGGAGGVQCADHDEQQQGDRVPVVAVTGRAEGRLSGRSSCALTRLRTAFDVLHLRQHAGPVPRHPSGLGLEIRRNALSAGDTGTTVRSSPSVYLCGLAVTRPAYSC